MEDLRDSAGHSEYCPGCGFENPCRPLLDPEKLQKQEDGGLRAEVKFSSLYQGIMGRIHGGSLVTLLDEVMVYLLVGKGFEEPVTHDFRIKYVGKVEVGQSVCATARLRKIRKNGNGFSIKAEAEIRDGNGEILTVATGFFHATREEEPNGVMESIVEEALLGLD